MDASFAALEKVVGLKQSLRALREGRVEKVYLACDADPGVIDRIEPLLSSVSVDREFTMLRLGELGGIAVGASVIALLRKK